MPYFFCALVPAAQRHVAAADDRMSADIVVGFDDDHRSALIARLDRRGHTRRPGADYHDIRIKIPIIRSCLCHRLTSAVGCKI